MRSPRKSQLARNLDVTSVVADEANRWRKLATTLDYYSGRLACRLWSEAVGCRIPECILKPEMREDLPDFRGLRPTGIGLQASRIPRVGETPELIYANQRSKREALNSAPFTHSFFRPEEKHFASGKHDVVPPVSGGHNTVK